MCIYCYFSFFYTISVKTHKLLVFTYSLMEAISLKLSCGYNTVVLSSDSRSAGLAVFFSKWKFVPKQGQKGFVKLLEW